MKVIHRDGLGLKALVGHAARLRAQLDDGNVTLGMIDSVDGTPVACIIPTRQLDDGKGTYPRIAVTIERNPRVVDLDG